MRKQFVKTVTDMLRKDNRYVLLLCDIGVFGFRDAFNEFPDRVYNVGILEQATVGMAAGLAMTGLIPIVHTIAPFIVERALDQLKVDFGYQELVGLFVSVGASYDYAALGCSHHCPADVSLIENIPGFHIKVPGNAVELDTAMKANLQSPTYIRMSEKSYDFLPGMLNLNAKDAKVAVIGIGPSVDMVLKASDGLPVYHIYSSTVIPFPLERLHVPLAAGIKKFIVVEPYYSSHLSDNLRSYAALRGHNISVENFSLPRKFFTGYGNKECQDKESGFTVDNLRVEIQQCTN